MKKGKKLEFLIKARFPYLSNRKFAEAAGVPPTTLQGVFNRGFDTVSISNAKKIAKALGVTVDALEEYLSNDNYELEGFREKSNVVSNNLEIYYASVKKQTMKSIDFFGHVSAGIPSSMEGIRHAEKIELPKVLLGKYQDRNDIFAMRVNGESMNRIIPNASIVICVPVANMDEVKNEDIVIFTKDNETSMKRFITTSEAIIFSPESNLRCFYDVVVERNTTNEVNINAKVISYHTFLD